MESSSRSRVAWTAGSLAAALLLFAGVAGAQQTGSVTGQVVDADTGQPLNSVQIFIPDLQIGVLTQQNGRYLLQNVPTGTHTVTAERLGYRSSTQEVTVAAGSNVLDFMLDETALALQEIVVTGLVDPVEGVRSPITVSRVSREMMPVVQTGSAVQNLQGRVPGLSMNRGSGEPGAPTNLMLRTPTSVTQTGNPLIVVDGVILGTLSTTNIESLDIESMEVVKGAAAASLYGSRAAAGVINIQTARGRALAPGQTRFTARMEVGRTETIRSTGYPTHHHYLVDDPNNPTTYVDTDGNPVDRADRTTGGGTVFMDNRFPGPVFDNLATVFEPGGFQSYNVTMSQNTETTNFHIAGTRRVERGSLANNDGYELNSFRLNLDHRFRDNFGLSVSAYHSRDWRDNVVAGFDDIMEAPVDVDLGAKDETGQFQRVVGGDIPFENPLWLEASREDERRRIRTLASTNLIWSPRPWIDFSGGLSYDRMDEKERLYVPKGTPTSVTDDTESDGLIDLETDLNDTWNGEAQMTLRRDVGPLNVRTTLRALMERERNEGADASGENFFVPDVPDIGAAEVRDSQSSESEVRSNAYMWNLAFDYDGKYILEGLVRRDESSLFGPDNREHNYYRVAAAYRIGEEDWFDIPNVDEFKLSYARGTAGGRPGFTAQYETWNVSSTGVSKGNLGNRNLRPEHTLEQEVSLETILFDRVGIDLAHAWQRTTDQLVNAAVPSITGYSSQWSNGGTVTGYSTELSVQTMLLQTPDFLWDARIIADRSRGKIENWAFACQNPTWRYYCSDVGIYEVWGGRFVRSRADLATHHGGAAEGAADEFEVNDDGYLVWVGAGNSYRDGAGDDGELGTADDLWGTSTTIGGAPYAWGMPFLDANADGSGNRQQIGDGSHTNLGWMNNFTWRGLTLHTQVHAQIGGDAINRSHQEMVLVNRYPDMDQSGKPDALKKPVQYYSALEGGTGNDAWMEDGSYIKLRTLSLSYQLRPAQLSGIGLGGMGLQSMNVELTGRNIFTITDYSGFDPEQALNFGSRQNQDRFSYPNTRNYTLAVQVAF